MSRSDSQQITDTTKAQNATEYQNSQNSYTQAQKDAGDYADAVSKYAAANPYNAGGEFQSDTNRQLTNTADAGAQSVGNELQSAAVRTGTNSSGAIAATESMEEANERALGGDEASADQARLAAGAQYGQTVAGDTAAEESMEQNLAAGQSGAALGDVNAENTASAANQSFMDQFGASFSKGLGSALSGSSFEEGLGQGVAKCWIAAEIFGGWYEPRTILVRGWLNGPFSETWYGRKVMALYVRYGECIAKKIRTEPILRWIFTPLFNWALKKARGM